MAAIKGDWGFFTGGDALNYDTATSKTTAIANWDGKVTPTTVPPLVEIATKASSGSIFGAASKGDLYVNVTSGNKTPASGDAYYDLPQKKFCIRSWSIELTRNSIEITTLCDQQSRSIFGRTNLTGTITMQYQTDFAASTTEFTLDDITKRFFDTVSFDTASGKTAAAKTEQTDNPIAFIGYSVYVDANQPYIEFFYIPRVNLGGFNVGGEVGDNVQEISSQISLARDPLNRSVKRYLVKLPS